MAPAPPAPLSGSAMAVDVPKAPPGPAAVGGASAPLPGSAEAADPPEFDQDMDVDVQDAAPAPPSAGPQVSAMADNPTPESQPAA
eukprot:3237975-Pyramimonas_sp.AAC.1